MRFALSNNERIEPTKGAKGFCPCCGAELVARCGEIKRHHWAHKKKCDDHWWENETDWHRNWKNQFPKEWQEIIQRDESGEKHIADVKTGSGWTIEFQHSPISKEERDSRDYFYNKLIWVVDGTRRKTDIKQFDNLFFYVISPNPRIYLVKYPEDSRLIKEWGSSKSLVFIDFGINDLWLIYEGIYVSSFSRNSFIEMMNNTLSDEVYKGLLNPIQKAIDDNEIIQEEIRRDAERVANEEDLKIRKEYGIKDDEDWFDGRWGIKVYKRHGDKVVLKRPKPKIPYVIGICRNRFHYFDIKVASSILNNYVEVMKKLDYTDEQIEDEFDINVIPKTIDVKNWTEWKNLMGQLKQKIGKK